MELNEILMYLNPMRIRGTRWRPITIVGPPESGKTTAAFFLSKKIVETNGEDEVNVVYTRRLKSGINNMDDRRIQIIIVDDAVRFQYSRVFSSTEGRIAVSNYYEIRHIYNQYRKEHRDAVVIVMFLTQRWRDLAPQFRESPIVLFKGTLTSVDSNRDIKKLIGERYFDVLREITREIYVFANDEAKSKAIASTSWMNAFIVSGIRKEKPKHINFIDDDDSIEDLVDEFVKVILNKFGENTLKIPNSIIRGYIRQWALDHSIDIIPLDAVDIAKYRAYELFGFKEEQPGVNISEMAEQLLKNSILKNPEKWDILSEDEKLGFVLYNYPYLTNKDAGKIVKIIDFLATDMGLKTKYISTGQAAMILGVTPRTIINMIHRGKITDVIETEGGHYRVNIAQIMKLKNKKNRKNGK